MQCDITFFLPSPPQLLLMKEIQGEERIQDHFHLFLVRVSDPEKDLEEKLDGDEDKNSFSAFTFLVSH